jgi:two-component system sensor histidine kinase GlrK
MPAYRPRSIVSLIVVGFAVVLTPFIAAVVTAVVQVDQLASRGRGAVLDARSAADDSRQLVQQVTNMQRALGQYQLSGERALYDIYLDQRESFRDTLNDLTTRELAAFGGGLLEALAENERELFGMLGEQGGTLRAGRSWDEVLDRLQALDADARSARTASNELIEAQANEATVRAESVQRTLLVLTAAAVPATVFLIALFTVLITRPLQTLGRAIRQLGARAWDEPIAVAGPQDLEALGRELDWLRRRIRSLEAQKTSFLRHISHELKTPLTTLREGSELLSESLGEDRPEEAEIARLMQVNSLHLQTLIENLLKFARTLEPDTDLAIENAVDLAGLVAASVAAQMVAADAKDIVVEQRLGDVRVRGDKGKLKIVVDNLLGNAIKFTPPEGGIRVTLASGDGFAELDVEDSGPGIDRADAERIFEPFVQGGAEYEASVKGTGLGLAIVKEYAEAHGGAVAVVESDAGAHFRVRLPIAGPAVGPDNG